MNNLNAPPGMAGEAVYAPYLVLSEEKSKYPVLKAENPVFREDEPNMNAFAVEKLLKVFSINLKTVMRYTDADENIIFVQSQATLKVSTDGVMTYNDGCRQQRAPRLRDRRGGGCSGGRTDTGRKASNRRFKRCVERRGHKAILKRFRGKSRELYCNL